MSDMPINPESPLGDLQPAFDAWYAHLHKVTQDNPHFALPVAFRAGHRAALAQHEQNRIQPCGHDISQIVSGGEGTNYCGQCQREQAIREQAEKIAELHQLRQRVKHAHDELLRIGHGASASLSADGDDERTNH